MEIKKYYWRWKSTTIDFSKIPDEYPNGLGCKSKKDNIFMQLPLPDKEIHDWYNSGWSYEYDEALKFAKEYGLIEFIEVEEDE